MKIIVVLRAGKENQKARSSPVGASIDSLPHHEIQRTESSIQQGHRRHKTGKAMTSRLHPPVKEIIAKCTRSGAMRFLQGKRRGGSFLE